MAINGNNYDMLEKTTDVTLVASTLKLFFRELPQPIISEALNKTELQINVVSLWSVSCTVRKIIKTFLNKQNER